MQRLNVALLRRGSRGFHFLNHATDCVAQFFDHMSISGQSVSLRMVKNKSRVWVAYIIEGYIAVQIGI